MTNTNRVDRWLVGATLALAVMLGAQWAVINPGESMQRVWVADWAENPESLDDVVEAAEEVVLGRVTRVRRGPDIVMRVDGEPEEDRIPTEAVTIQVERRYKSAREGGPATIEVFRTGTTKGTPPSAMGGQPPESPPDGMRRPSRPSPPGDRTVMLTDDPPYQNGQRYLLALKPGPQMRVDGQAVHSRRPVSPEGRFLVDGQNRIVPVSDRADFVRSLRGRGLDHIEAQLRGRP